MEGVIAVAAPFVMVVAIVYLIQNGKNRRAELERGRTREDDVVAATRARSTAFANAPRSEAG